MSFHYMVSENETPIFTATDLPKATAAVRVACVADTHLREEETSVPPCDVLLHAGDILYRSGAIMSTQSAREAFEKFCVWLGRQPCRYGVVICGNHDMRLKQLGRQYLEQHLPRNFVYLENECVEVCGLKIFGSPNSVGSSPNSAWQEGSSEGIWPGVRRHGNLDIVMSHGPAFYHGKGRDKADPHLAGHLLATDCRLHVSGHLHWAYGLSHLQEGEKRVSGVCCSILDGSYRPTNHPFVIDMEPRAADAPAPAPVAPQAAPVLPKHLVVVLMFHAKRYNHVETMKELCRQMDGRVKYLVARTAEEAASLAASSCGRRATAVVGVGDRTKAPLVSWQKHNDNGHLVAKALCSGAYLSAFEKVHAAGVHLLTYSAESNEGVPDINAFVTSSAPGATSKAVTLSLKHTTVSHPSIVARFSP